MKPENLKEIIDRAFTALGFKMIHFNTPMSANGVDCWVQREGRKPLSVEIKRARKQTRGMVQVEPVLKNRQGDDLVAIIMNSEYVLIEPMKDHLKCCSPKGTRQFTIMS